MNKFLISHKIPKQWFCAAGTKAFCKCNFLFLSMNCTGGISGWEIWRQPFANMDGTSRLEPAAEHLHLLRGGLPLGCAGSDSFSGDGKELGVLGSVESTELSPRGPFTLQVTVLLIEEHCVSMCSNHPVWVQHTRKAWFLLPKSSQCVPTPYLLMATATD